VAKVTYKWVRGHQENGGEEARLNNRADKLAGEGHKAQEMKDVMLSGETISVWQGGVKICKQVAKEIRRTATEPQYKRYMCDKLGWSGEHWEAIDWRSYKLGRRGLQRYERTKLTKLTIGWVMDPRRSSLLEGGENGTCGWCSQAQEQKYHVYCCPAGEACRRRLWYDMRSRLEKLGGSIDVLEQWEDLVTSGARGNNGSVEATIFGFIRQEVVKEQVKRSSNEHWGTIAAREWMKWSLAVWTTYVEALHAEEGAAIARLDQRIQEAYQKIARDESWSTECKTKEKVLLRQDVTTKQQWLDYWLAKFKNSGGKRQVTLVQLFRGSK
jgi:hypothetical protein